MQKMMGERDGFPFEIASRTGLVIGALCMSLCVVYYLIYFQNTQTQGQTELTVSEIYIYPIKSLRPVKLQEALATKYGFQYDRRFLLLKKEEENEYINMAVSSYPEMTQFLQDFQTYDKSGNKILNITFKAFGDVEKEKCIEMPLAPDTEKLEPFDVDMHGSPTRAFKMPAEYSTWFSSCFGYDVVLVYLGASRRSVLFADMLPKNPPFLTRFLGSISKRIKGLLQDEEPWGITFADCAPYLITSQTSLENVSSRLPEGEDADITKFRPNVVVQGAHEAWQEDFWAAITINKGAEIIMTHNCVRCQSVNVDYNTGKPGKGPTGEILKRMQKDRRVDAGAKWSPVFGRYGFWDPRRESQMVRVGDRVDVSKVNERRTVWNWPDL